MNFSLSLIPDPKKWTADPATLKFRALLHGLLIANSGQINISGFRIFISLMDRIDSEERFRIDSEGRICSILDSFKQGV